jgi:hypothetical protein
MIRICTLNSPEPPCVEEEALETLTLFEEIERSYRESTKRIDEVG